MAEEQENGVMLQGAEGDIFFIPADRLSEFRVADEDASGVKSALEEADGDEVSGFSFKEQQQEMQERYKPGVSAVRAFQGPIGIKPPVMQLTEGDGIWR